jgi:hypothetical protein
MDQGAGALGDRCRLGNRLYDPGFVVGQHDRDQGRRSLDCQRLRQGIEPHQPQRVDRQLFRRRRPSEHGIVFDCRDQDTFTPGPGQGQVVGLRPTTGEDDIFGRRGDQRRDLFAGILDRAPGGAAEAVDGGRVAGKGQSIGDRPGGGRAHRHRRVAVHVDGIVHCARSPRCARTP